tara:strand:+ start:11013 stop:12512 length:1500 start_codon:yes stop_codon:yes gene_type:complete
MSKPHYINHPNPNYRGNPLAEGMGYPLSRNSIQVSSNKAFEGTLDLTDVPVDLYGYYNRSAILNLFSLHVCQDEMVDVYEIIRHGIEYGYLGRNPNEPEIGRMLAAIERDKNEPLKALNIKRLNMLENSFSYLIAGLSGRGKSAMVKMALTHIVQKIPHDTHIVLNGNKAAFTDIQITYIYVEHHDRVGQKAFLISILQAIDGVIGDAINGEKRKPYAYENRNGSVFELMNAVRKAVVVHHIGAFIIDEAQNFAPAAKDLKIGTQEKTSMKFVEELINTLGVSSIFVGTLSTLTLFEKEVTITRRTIRCGSMILLGCPLNNSFWMRLTDQLFKAVGPAYSKDELFILRTHLHGLTAGIPAIAVSLVQSTLRFLSYHDKEGQRLTTDAFDFVFEQQFKLLHGPMAALIDEDYDKFEDFKPIKLLKEINPKSAGEEQLNELNKEAEKVYQLWQKKTENLKTGKYQLAPPQEAISHHQVEASDASNKLSPDNFMALIEGEIS